MLTKSFRATTKCPLNFDMSFNSALKLFVGRAAGILVVCTPALVKPAYLSSDPVADLNSNVPVAAVVAPVVASEVPAQVEDLKAVIANEVRAEARRYISQRVSGEIRAHLAQETTRQVEKVKEGVSDLIKNEIASQVKAQVAVMLREDDALSDLMDKQLMRVEQGVEGKAREVLDRIVDENRYQTIDAALRRNLEEKIHRKVGMGVLVIACSNTLILGAMAMLLVNRK